MLTRVIVVSKYTLASTSLAIRIASVRPIFMTRKVDSSVSVA